MAVKKAQDLKIGDLVKKIVFREVNGYRILTAVVEIVISIRKRDFAIELDDGTLDVFFDITFLSTKNSNPTIKKERYTASTPFEVIKNHH